MRRWRAALERLMRGKGWGSKTYRFVTMPLGWGYGLAVKGRNLYWDLRGGQKVGLPIVSVGNVVAGGTGKSDVVVTLAEKLPGKVAILSRGYGVKVKRPFLVKDHPASICGDEPRMLADLLPGCLVIVGPDRVEGARLAKRLGASVAVLDDGMQHRRLHRDLEIVVAGEADGYLPMGLLRDDPKRVLRADLVLVTERQKAGCLLQSRIEGVFSLKDERMPSIQGVKVALFCGIGNPDRFVKTVEELGAKICGTLFLADHERATRKELEAFLKKSQADYLVCTYKDRVKVDDDLPILWVKRRLFVDENNASWQKAMAKIRNLI